MLDAMKGGWKDQRHASWMSSFERHVFPLVGGKAVTAIDSAALLTVLEPIWLTIPDTAKRVLQRYIIENLSEDEIRHRSRR